MPSVSGEKVSSRSPPKAKKARLSVTIEMPEGNDRYCWKCHTEEANVPCTTCQRSFHEYCVGETDLHNLVCKECMTVIKSERESIEGSGTGPLSKLTPNQLSDLLLCAVKFIRPYALDLFHKPVSLEEYPDYKDFVVKPFDLEQLEQNIIKGKYSCTAAFTADMRWIYHNTVVYNGPQNRISSSAHAMLKVGDSEVNEMTLCPECYMAMRKPQVGDTIPGIWFAEPCCVPHIIVWAKIRGFPYWPAKVMSLDTSDQATVKFFGAHDRSMVPIQNCTLLTNKPPVNQKSKKGSYNAAMEEIATYVKRYREKFGIEFCYETESIKLTREMYEKRMSVAPLSPLDGDVQGAGGGGEGGGGTQDEPKLEPGEEEEDQIKTVLISRVPLLEAEQDDKDSGEEEQNSILESIKRKLNLDKKSDSTDDDKDMEESPASPQAAAPAPQAETKNIPSQSTLSIEDTPKSPERTNCAEVSSTTADADPPPVIPKVATGDTFLEKLRQTIEECKEKVGVSELSSLPAPADNYDDESETDVSDTEIMGFQQRALGSPKKDVDFASVEVQTEAEEEVRQEALHPQDMRLNQELVAREMELWRDKKFQRELAQQKAMWQTSMNRMTDVIKSKQWCCVCKALATMTCCWNTSYCSQTCQSTHWPVHIKSCERSAKR